MEVSQSLKGDEITTCGYSGTTFAECKTVLISGIWMVGLEAKTLDLGNLIGVINGLKDLISGFVHCSKQDA